MSGIHNKLSDLNNHLFAELERLGDEDLTGEALDQEISRARAITAVAQKVVANGQLVLDAVKVKNEYMGREEHLPALLEE